MKKIIMKFLAILIIISAIVFLAYSFLIPVDFGDEDNNIYLQLENAIYMNKLSEVEELLYEHSIDLNDEGLYTALPLFIATENAYNDMIDLLVNNGADVNKQHFMGYGMLLNAAVYSECIETINRIVEYGYDINEVDHQDSNAMAFALRTDRDINVLKHLVKMGIHSDFNDLDNRNYLHMAAEKGSKEIYDYFLNISVNESQKTKNEETVLHYAAMSGDLEFFKYILSRGFDIYEKDKFNQSVIHLSTSYDIVDYILEEYSFDINGVSEMGTPLFRAIGITDEAEREKVTKLLIKNGADVNLETTDWRPIHYAVFHMDYNIVELLINNKVDVNSMSEFGESPLHIAVDTVPTQESVEILKLLLDAGADPSVRDDNGNRPIDIAVIYGNKEAIELLK